MSATRWPKHPLIYEINTWTWLSALTHRHQRPITLARVPEAELDALAEWGIDAVWLMGIWERSAAAQRIARQHPDLQNAYRQALPDLTPEDIVGSPYAVQRYEVAAALGGREELAALRERLAERGLRLILDFVPNHVAIDHPWLENTPECLIQGALNDLNTHTDAFFLGPKGRVFAHGRDPYFPPWTDTAQLHAFSPRYRQKARETLREIAAQCDGVRCDMAMLVTNRIFAQTWGERAGAPPEEEFWPSIIPAIKTQFPDFLFLAEVYWDMEWELQQQGFDYTYDKRLYDHLLHDNAHAVLGQLHVSPEHQARMLHFIENHDEPRAVVALGRARSLAAAVLVTTLPGAALLHEGQFEGHRVKVPVQLARRPEEPTDPRVKPFYRLLMAEVCHPVYRQGEWRLRECTPAWSLNATHRNLIAYTWRDGDERRLVVVNYSDAPAQGRVILPDFELNGRTWTLYDTLHLYEYQRDGSEIADNGLYVDLPPWHAHIFAFG